MTLEAQSMQLAIDRLKGKVDFAILTIREDECDAVLDRFQPRDHTQGLRRYEVGTLNADNGRTFSFLVGRCVRQGEGEAQRLTDYLIQDVDPDLFVLVGIAGAVPSADFTLGDVVCATHVHDFSVRAAAEGGRDSFNVSGGEMHPSILSMLGSLPQIVRTLPEWNTPAAIGRAIPPVEVPTPASRTLVYGSLQWRKKVCESLARHFPGGSPVRNPIATARSVASSDALVKDTETLQAWLMDARAVGAVEMELGGVYMAARKPHREYPVLAIRGISDVVGFRRAEEWTTFACHGAASFAHALFRSGALGGSCDRAGPAGSQGAPVMPGPAADRSSSHPDQHRRRSQIDDKNPPGPKVEVSSRSSPGSQDKLRVCGRLSRVEAFLLAEYFRMPAGLRGAIPFGQEARGVWDYASDTKQLDAFPEALCTIGRIDLVPLLPGRAGSIRVQRSDMTIFVHCEGHWERVPDEQDIVNLSDLQQTLDERAAEDHAKAWAQVHSAAEEISRTYRGVYDALVACRYGGADEARIAVAESFTTRDLPRIEALYSKMAGADSSVTQSPQVSVLLRLPRYHFPILTTIRNYTVEKTEFQNVIDLVNRTFRISFRVLSTTMRVLAHHSGGR
jgi:nucleoside phosphorylase